MTLWQLVQQLDGWGLVIENDDDLREGFAELGIDPDQEIPVA